MRLSCKLSKLFKVSLEFGINDGKCRSVTSQRNPISLPRLLLLGGRKSCSTRKNTCSSDSLPLEDFEGETSTDLDTHC
jgi:hypothetical protein